VTRVIRVTYPTVLLVLFVPNEEVVLGVELLTTGRITLPVPEPDRAYLRAVRRGERSLAEVLDAITETEVRLGQLSSSPAVPAEPDRRWVDDWLHRSHLNYWASQMPD
jgi:hypothetical protein